MKILFPSLTNVFRPLVIVIALAAIPLNVGCQKMLPSDPKGDVLVYEVDPDSIKDGQQVNMDKLVDAVDTRLNSGPSRIAVVKKIGDRQLEIAMMRKHDVEKQRVEKLLVQSGNLELRFLAHKRYNKDIIERALADPSKQIILNDEGKRLGWWIPVKAGEENILEKYYGIIARKKIRNDRECMEVLVADDPFDVTGAYIDKANAGIDTRDRLSVDFAFNKEGGRRLEALTSTYTSEELETNLIYLGIILDDILYSAPILRDKIKNHGQISGSFNREQVNDIVLLLNSGALPCKLRPVEKTSKADEGDDKKKD